MPAKLRITPLAGEPFELTIGNTATIGRTADNTVCLSGSPLVSRQHALIRCHDGYQYQIIDLGSRNGTFVNGQRVVMPMTLAPGARVEVAKNEIIFDLIEDDISTAHLEVTMAGSMAGIASAIRPVALLVCDIRGFSTMAEKIDSSHLAQQLGVWFREAGNLVTKSGGTVDKFIGDAVLAYWSECDGASVDCAATLRIAREMLALARQNEMGQRRPVPDRHRAALWERHLRQRRDRRPARRHHHRRPGQHRLPARGRDEGTQPAGPALRRFPRASAGGQRSSSISANGS